MFERVFNHASAVLIALLIVSCGDSTTSPETDNNPDNSGSGSEETFSYSHTEKPGISANDFLSNSGFSRLTVEIDYMAGYELDPEALSSLETFLKERLTKSDIQLNEPTEIAAGGQDQYMAGEIRNIEQDHRDHFTEDETLAVYILVTDARYEQENVLGIAYYNTSAALFGHAIDEISGGLGQPSRHVTEATTLRHEFGHLFGLVGIEGSGTEMKQEHQDTPHGNHCDNKNCLMYYAIESADLFANVFGGSIPDLDLNCIDDLQANGGK
ncbi:MAG: hypothetical protein R3281_05685 [Balneolaceae bacterium]|nr:hypothetical protein [Balneolaceae bacterium]